ncbi:MAG: acyl-CoA dehydrogenase family protein [Microthrixaceae bacterium]
MREAGAFTSSTRAGTFWASTSPQTHQEKSEHRLQSLARTRKDQGGGPRLHRGRGPTCRARIREGDLENTDRDAHIGELIALRNKAQSVGLWLPHMPEEWGGMGLGHVELAMVQAEAAKSYYGSWVLNCQAPDEGNMHTLLHWGTDEQKEKYLKGLCAGRHLVVLRHDRTQVAGSDPTLIRTSAYEDGEEWVINGHKWFISNAHRASLSDRGCPDRGRPRSAPGRQHRLHRGHPDRGLDQVRQIETMRIHRALRVLIEDLRVHEVPDARWAWPGHLLGQYRLGPARLAHCMRWIAQAETALDMMVDRSRERYSTVRSWPRSRVSSG